MNIARTSREARGRNSLSYNSIFTQHCGNPVEWVPGKDFEIAIFKRRGEAVARQLFEAPCSWSYDEAAYWFYHHSLARETSVVQTVIRLTNHLAKHGLRHEFFASGTDAVIFKRELAFLLIRRLIEFNTGVWRACGSPWSSGPKDVRVKVNISALLESSASEKEILQVVEVARGSGQILESTRDNAN